MADRLHSPGALRAIGLFKLAKGLLLVVAGLGALKLVREDPGTLVPRLMEHLNLAVVARRTSALLDELLRLPPQRLEALGVGSFAYGALFLVEGVGLWLQRRWAEYVTVISTAGFIPLELYELSRRFDAMRVVVLALNVLIVAYLVWRLRGDRREARLQPAG